ncbi:2OG-Fe dioxygenase family protein [Halomonas eurihalina]|uniref:2OG-Fe dioxygenase family protein n=1 Tax=Halomonas eurihalina TaxID=42566 RepID=A0A5D9DCG3_HALER|nr:2OG-Fe dioxygenase family protein [Halomonas eurihalina]MDR5858314.1 2OG-Fe dioxygenase family protein [Halomonas eurihalina]TZG41193.1 2OG-Fe dioxygenase family protein [Halomonas eurihalina]
MKLDTLKYGFDITTMPSNPLGDYWPPGVTTQLAQQDWAMTNLRNHLDLAAWQAFTTDLPRDPYVDRRWKRMSWLALDQTGDVRDMGHCPMAQGGAFNNAESMADRLRYYAPLTNAFQQRPDVKAFVRAWAGLWNIQANEPILMQITGVRGEDRIDPLQGQGIHADGCKALSIMVVSRRNVTGAGNHLYVDKAGTQPVAEVTLDPGGILHLRDDRLYHSVDAITQQDADQPFERFIIIINSRFVDPFQNRILRRHFPDAVLNEA